MGKAIKGNQKERDRIRQVAAPNAIDCDCCTPSDLFAHPKLVDEKVAKLVDDAPTRMKEQSTADAERKELVIVGAGPHALALVLRLLEPEADLLSDKERHIQADYSGRMRPLAHVRRHIQDLHKGPSAVLKKWNRKKKAKEDNVEEAPPLTLDFVRENVLVLDGSLETDAHGQQTSGIHGWMTSWVKNFEALNIEYLRSAISAHLDPFDHRSLEIFAAQTGRDKELLPMKYISKKTGRWDFHGPYNCPSSEVFLDFHKQLVTGYGVQDMVQPGMVQNIRVPTKDAKDVPLFELTVYDPNTGRMRIVHTHRVVGALGPAHQTDEPILNQIALDDWVMKNRVFRSHQIVPFLHQVDQKAVKINSPLSVLIVGGGITSAHLALKIADDCQCDWCQSVTLIQRSKTSERQFDLDDAWMGPARGKRLDAFWALSMERRAASIQEERGGGSIPPEVLRLLQMASKKAKASRCSRLMVHEETEIMDVQYDWRKDKLLVSMDNGLPTKEFDMIWLATGFENRIENYRVLKELLEDLPVCVIDGLPVLNQDLSWKAKTEGAICTEEPEWKRIARKRLWIMGPLAGLELGPDALNLMGARQGAVRVAKSIRSDIYSASLASKESVL